MGPRARLDGWGKSRLQTVQPVSKSVESADGLTVTLKPVTMLCDLVALGCCYEFDCYVYSQARRVIC